MSQCCSDGLPYEKRADGKGEAECIEKEIPFELPEGWAWTRLKTISTDISYGISNSAEKTGNQKLLRITDIHDQKVNWNAVPFTNVDAISFKNNSIMDGDILFARIGATVGKTYLAADTPANAVYASYLIRVRLAANMESYLIRYFDTPTYWQAISESAVGSGRPNVNGGRLAELVIPIPPLSEQRRIVAALDKYLALVDEIERNRADLESLFSQLKSKVLDLAIRGELTERDPGDEPASELLARIHEEKLAMVERGELKPKDAKGDTVIYAGSDGLRYEKPADGKGEPKCIEKEIPFELPKGWAWARLNFLVNACGGKTPAKSNNAYWDGGGVPWITSKDMKAARLYGSQVEISELAAQEMTLIPPESLLVVVRSGILRRVLPVSINMVETTVNQDLKALIPFETKFAQWLYLCFSAWDKKIRDTYHKDGTTVDSIEFDRMLAILLPIPPLAEQRRIAEVVESIFAVTNL